MVNIMVIFLSIFIVLFLILFHLRHESEIRRIFHKMRTLRDELLDQTETIERELKEIAEIFRKERDEFIGQIDALKGELKGCIEISNKGISNLGNDTKILRESAINLSERVFKMEESRGLDTVKLDSLTQNIKELSHLLSDFQYDLRYDLFLNYTLQLAEEAKAKGFINKDNYEKFAQIIHEIKVDKYSQSLGH